MNLSISVTSAFLAATAMLAGAVSFSERLAPLAAPVRLPSALSEVSGLAPASATSVYAHNDEQATIYEIDIATGKALRSFSLGRPPLIGDFEAIVAVGDRVAMIASDGRLFEATIEPRRRSLAHRATDTGVGAGCEVESLARADGNYFIACKRAKGRLVVFRWADGERAQQVIDMKLKGAVPNPDAFRAADIARDPTNGAFLVLDSSAGAILEISRKGEPVSYRRLGGDHPQAEGLALMADGRLVVADERKAGGGALTVYPPRR